MRLSSDPSGFLNSARPPPGELKTANTWSFAVQRTNPLLKNPVPATICLSKPLFPALRVKTSPD